MVHKSNTTFLSLGQGFQSHLATYYFNIGFSKIIYLQSDFLHLNFLGLLISCAEDERPKFPATSNIIAIEIHPSKKVHNSLLPFLYPDKNGLVDRLN